MVSQAQRPTIRPVLTVVVSLLLLLALFLLPLVLPAPGREDGGEALPPPSTAEGPAPVQGWDRGETLRLLHSDGSIERMTLEEYLWGVVAAEMPVSFHSEALKAQAVCARTYCVYQREDTADKHSGADVCDDYTCCQAYLTHAQAEAQWGENARQWSDKVTAAVADTDGLLCLYEGEPIDAVFFSSSAGQTRDAAAVWGTEIPYLTAVKSPEGVEVPGWQTVVTYTHEEFAQLLHAAAPEAQLSQSPEQWFADLVADEAGAVSSVTIGGVPFTGGEARAAFALRSTNFTAAADREKVNFWVTGYGHGVGMSQYGANALAEQGRAFWEILEWYYTGAKVDRWQGEEK